MIGPVPSSESSMTNLRTIYLEGNPLQADMGVNYRRKIKLACPQLTQIDATLSFHFLSLKPMYVSRV